MYQYLSEAQPAVAHSIEQRKDAKQLRMYMYIITEGKVCTRIKTRCNVVLAHVLAFYRNNVGRIFLLHMPIQVDVTTCFQPISCMCSICVCQVVFELYCINACNFCFKFKMALFQFLSDIIVLNNIMYVTNNPIHLSMIQASSSFKHLNMCIIHVRHTYLYT